MALAAVIAAVLGSAGDAFAHQASITRSFVTVDDGRKQVDYRMTVTPADLAEPLGLPVDTDPTDAQVTAGADALLAYVLGHVTVKNGVVKDSAGRAAGGAELDDAVACPAEPRAAEIIHSGSRFIQLTWTMRCERPIQTLIIDYDLFFELDALHRGFLRVDYGDKRGIHQFKPGEGRYAWTLAEPPPSIITHFIVEGIEHIVLGYDHVAFLLGLLLVVAVCRRPSEPLQPRGVRAGLRYTGAIVTSFTVAHSITLIAASLGWISLGARIVESVIALSIAYVAIENIIRPDAPRRYLITFAFGLIHGLGFASVLADSLPPSDVIAPLLLFNVGVELGQLTIVTIVLPTLIALTRAIGVERYRAIVINIGSGLLAAFGLIWMVERIFEVTILGI